MLFSVMIRHTNGDHDVIFVSDKVSVAALVLDALEDKEVSKIEVLTEDFELTRLARDAFAPVNWRRG
jgi:hypothetical protein